MQKAAHIEEVIQFIDFFKSKSYYYIVTEYQEGSVDLYSYMETRKQKFTERETRLILKDIFNAVRQLHEIEIMHRDLKLQNILYNPEKKKAKVIDFGLAICFPDP